MHVPSPTLVKPITEGLGRGAWGFLAPVEQLCCKFPAEGPREPVLRQELGWGFPVSRRPDGEHSSAGEEQGDAGSLAGRLAGGRPPCFSKDWAWALLYLA